MTPAEEVLSTLDDARARRQDPLCRRVEFFRLAPDEVARGCRQARLPALRRQPDLLLADRPRLRMGADAARPRPGARRGGLVAARMGPSHRQDPPRPTDARGQPPAQDRRFRPARAGRARLSRRRGDRRGRQGNRQERLADRAELAAAASDRLDADHRRAQRGAVARESRRGRLDLDQGPDRKARCREQGDACPIPTGTSAPPSPTAIRRRCSDGQLPDRSAPRALAKAVPTRFPVPEGLLPAQEPSGSCRVAIHPAIS